MGDRVIPSKISTKIISSILFYRQVGNCLSVFFSNIVLGAVFIASCCSLQQRYLQAALACRASIHDLPLIVINIALFLPSHFDAGRDLRAAAPHSHPLWCGMIHCSLWIRPHPRFRPKTALQKAFIFFIARCVFLYILSPMPLVTTCTGKPWLLRNLKNLQSRFLRGDKLPNWWVDNSGSLCIFIVPNFVGS